MNVFAGAVAAALLGAALSSCGARQDTAGERLVRSVDEAQQTGEQRGHELRDDLEETQDELDIEDEL